MPYQDAVALVTALYLYYGVSPQAKIKGTGDGALKKYVEYSMEKVTLSF